VSGQDFSVSPRVVSEMIRLAALEVPGVQRVGRAGAPWRRLYLGRSIVTRVRDRRVTVRLSLVARPGHALEPLAAQVRAAVGAAVERLLGLEVESVTVIVDGIGG
jgi:uncharacterized alkaline shock family protein YloU